MALPERLDFAGMVAQICCDFIDNLSVAFRQVRKAKPLESLLMSLLRD